MLQTCEVFYTYPTRLALFFPIVPNGLFNLNKPMGLTSHDVVARVRRITQQRRVGHAGTLDPMATGVLLVCVGTATRLLEYLVGGQKRYQATIRLGVTTDTLDAMGQVKSEQDPSGVTEANLRAALPQFLGTIEQVPPIFSAIKQGGQSIHKRARRGEEVQVEPRQVTIQTLDWVAWQPPDLTLEVTCSAGTYIRSLARDLGEAVGVGAHLAGLVRLASGAWSVEQAVTLDDLATDWAAHLWPFDAAAAHLPRVDLDEVNTRHVQHGRAIRLEVAPETLPLRAYSATGELLAILRFADDVWKPHKVFSDAAND